MHQATIVGLAWPTVFLIVGLVTAFKLAPAIREFAKALRARTELELDEQRITNIERETAAQIAAGSVNEQIAANQAQLDLEAARQRAEQQAIESDPEATHEYVNAKRAADLKAYEATATARAQVVEGTSAAELNAEGYREYVREVFAPASFEAWSRRQ